MPRQKTCKQCGAPYTPRNTLQAVCGQIDCAIAESRARSEKRLKRELRARREKGKTITELANEAQNSFNLYIRERDKCAPCISCDQPAGQGQRHASHYRSSKAASQLRYNTYNVHASCAPCNNHLSGNIVEYRLSLIHKIGEDKVKWLENNQNTVKYTPEYLRRLKKIFAKRARHIRKLRDQ